jgi:hypothetical protein
MTLPVNKQNLNKSASLNEKMIKVGARLYNITMGTKDNCQIEKVMKVPIAQKSFNL